MRYLIPALCLAVASCGPSYSPNTYASGAVQQAAKVEKGVVVGVRPVDVSASGTTGAVTGGAAGGIVGSQTPGGGVGAAFGALGGTVIGGIVGTSVEHVTADTTAFEYIVRVAKGELVSVTQKDRVALPVGQHVLVIAGKQAARIVPDYTVSISPEPTAPPTPPLPDKLPGLPARVLPDAPLPGAPPSGVPASGAPASGALPAT
ncbi:MAG: hypothetical protein KGQ40_12605, partial [Rhodospirillales bacterium]|nr:hypothetical protein [Rhodospirillales bacterium]